MASIDTTASPWNKIARAFEIYRTFDDGKLLREFKAYFNDQETAIVSKYQG